MSEPDGVVVVAAGTVELDLVESSDDFPVMALTTDFVLSATCFGMDLAGAEGIFFKPEYFESASEAGAGVDFAEAIGTKPTGKFDALVEAATGAGLADVTTEAGVDFAGA